MILNANKLPAGVSRTASVDAGRLFRLVDVGTTRSDLATRKEIKFAYRHADVGKLRRLLETNCRRLVHHEPVSTVRSIYFDDAQLTACRANLDGLGMRRKVRLRWYDAVTPGKDLYLEIKWRRSRVTGKHRMQLAADESVHQWSYKQIVRGLQQAIPGEHLGDLTRYCEPVVIVQYKREHFVSQDGCLRLTLDYDVTFYDQFGKRAISTRFARKLQSLVVLEGKTPPGREAELRRLLHPFSARISRCSKYVHGCRLLGHIHDSSLS